MWPRYSVGKKLRLSLVCVGHRRCCPLCLPGERAGLLVAAALCVVRERERESVCVCVERLKLIMLVGVSLEKVESAGSSMSKLGCTGSAEC
jgi:hypothetical protein